jgi:hypothetical protein
MRQFLAILNAFVICLATLMIVVGGSLADEVQAPAPGSPPGGWNNWGYGTYTNFARGNCSSLGYCWQTIGGCTPNNGTFTGCDTDPILAFSVQGNRQTGSCTSFTLSPYSCTDWASMDCAWCYLYKTSDCSDDTSCWNTILDVNPNGVCIPGLGFPSPP